MARRAGLIGVAVALSAPLFGGQASAAPAVVSGRIALVAVQTQASQTSHDVVIGAVTDHGVDRPTTSGRWEKVILKKGTFEINVVRFNRNAVVRVDTTGCSVAITGIARNERVGRGTGAYAGIHGTVTLRATGVAIEPVVNGTCDVHAKPVAANIVTVAVGTVSY